VSIQTPETQYGPAPTLKAMLLCDLAISEAGTNKTSLIGIFDRLYLTTIPINPRIYVYWKLVDAQGAYTFKLDFVDVRRDNVIDSVEAGVFEMPDPLQAYEMTVPLTVQISAPSLYEFRLYGNRQYIGSISFDALMRPEPGG